MQHRVDTEKLYFLTKETNNVDTKKRYIISYLCKFN